MNILYIGSFFEKRREQEIWQNSKKWIVIPGNTFQSSLINGIIEHQKSIDYIVNLPAIGSFPCRYKKIWFKSSIFNVGRIKGVNGGFLNLPLIKNYSIYISIKKHANRWAKTNPDNKKVILVYSLIEPYIKAAISIKKKYPDTKVCCIVLDLPQYFDDKASWIYKFVNKQTTKSIYNLIPNIDYFILLTEPMVDALGINGNKQWLLLEGLYLPQRRGLLPKSQKTILYTGKLDARFGIIDMIEAFTQIEDKDYKLWICGDGSDRNIVIDASKCDCRIKYWGLLKHEQILSMQTQVTLLLNPRKGTEEYTKYSFPSKTMEYMASGTPTVMYPLPGMPKEYYEYLVIIPDNTINTLKNVLVEWCNKSQIELDEFGAKAKKFILENKNAYVQSQRILNFINNRYEEEK